MTDIVSPMIYLIFTMLISIVEGNGNTRISRHIKVNCQKASDYILVKTAIVYSVNYKMENKLKEMLLKFGKYSPCLL